MYIHTYITVCVKHMQKSLYGSIVKSVTVSVVYTYFDVSM
jgi:hypothetical protein